MVAKSNGPDPKILTVSEILDAPDIVEEIVEVPEWGGAVRVRALTLDEYNSLIRESAVDGKVDLERAQRANLLALVKGIVEPQFTEEHLTLLGKKNAGALKRVMDVQERLTGMRREDVAAAKATFPPGLR